MNRFLHIHTMFKHIGHTSVVSALLLATIVGQFSLTADAGAFRAQAWWGDWFPFFSESTSLEAVPLETTSTDFVDVSESFSGSSAQSGYCGDGVTNWELGEQCDDYNTNDGDGCTSSCQGEYCGDGMCNNGENTWSCMSDCPSVCGNWMTEGSETCDDGNTNDGDGCTSSCQSEYCGDGICNNGETASGCVNDCPATCGNWTTEGSEACDDGNTNDGDGCSAACATESCGDGTQQANEECDDGNVNDNDGCSALCKRERCGDAIIQNGETCDEGDLNAASCDPPYNGGCGYCDVVSCEQIRVEGARCGDGVTQYVYEQCDDGNEDFSDGCVACKVAQCGDGYLYEGSEECDDGNILNDDGCSGFCTREDFYCGDGKVQGAEQCDPGTKCSITGVDCRPGVVPCPGGDEDVCEFPKNSGCDYGCSLVCGNGIIDEGETCDLGSECADTGVDCSAVENRPCEGGASCVARSDALDCVYCQKVQHYAAPTSSPFSQSSAYFSRSNSSGRSSSSKSSADIWASVCGNTIKEPGEECDDGNTNDNDGCSASCAVEYCGDTIAQAGEECDDGNKNNEDACTNECKKAYCGDGIIYAGKESCDPGKAGETATCNRDCTVAFCGDKKTNKSAGEQCDSGNPNQRCSSACLTLKETNCCTCYYEAHPECFGRDKAKCSQHDCIDGKDNDGDGTIDSADADCVSSIFNLDASEHEPGVQTNDCAWTGTECKSQFEVNCEDNFAANACEFARTFPGDIVNVPYPPEEVCTSTHDFLEKHSHSGQCSAYFDAVGTCVQCNTADCQRYTHNGCSTMRNEEEARAKAEELVGLLKQHGISSIIVEGKQTGIYGMCVTATTFSVHETGVIQSYAPCTFEALCYEPGQTHKCTDATGNIKTGICCQTKDGYVPFRHYEAIGDPPTCPDVTIEKGICNGQGSAITCARATIPAWTEANIDCKREEDECKKSHPGASFSRKCKGNMVSGIWYPNDWFPASSTPFSCTWHISCDYTCDW